MNQEKSNIQSNLANYYYKRETIVSYKLTKKIVEHDDERTHRTRQQEASGLIPGALFIQENVWHCTGERWWDCQNAEVKIEIKLLRYTKNTMERLPTERLQSFSERKRTRSAIGNVEINGM